MLIFGLKKPYPILGSTKIFLKKLRSFLFMCLLYPTFMQKNEKRVEGQSCESSITDGRMGGWTDRQKNGQTDRQSAGKISKAGLIGPSGRARGV